MKKIYTCLFFISLIYTSFAQLVAEDWTETDCEGIEHTFFTELDAGYAVVMEFVMPTGCAPCVTAAENIGPLVDEMNLVYDNMIKYYAFAYNNTYSCEIMEDWALVNSLNPHNEFNDGTDVLAYYGSMGMPTIIIVGGLDHEVHYEKMGFTVSGLDEIETAILAALGYEDTTTGISDPIKHPVNIYPNPANEIAVINFLSGYVSPENISLRDIKGAEIVIQPLLITPYGQNIISFNVSSIPNGFYIIEFIDNGVIFTEKLIVNH